MYSFSAESAEQTERRRKRRTSAERAESTGRRMTQGATGQQDAWTLAYWYADILISMHSCTHCTIVYNDTICCGSLASLPACQPCQPCYNAIALQGLFFAFFGALCLALCICLVWLALPYIAFFGLLWIYAIMASCFWLAILFSIVKVQFAIGTC